MKECPRCGRCYPDSVATCAPDGVALSASFDGAPLLDGKYDLQRRLGSGGMGVVYLARHRSLHRDVAVKLVNPTRRGVEFAVRFRTEGAALGALKHPHIVDVSDFGIDPRGNGIPYLVLEYLRGVTLAHKLQEGPITTGDALPILTAVASAIDFAHERGVLHRDIKPENIFLVQDSKAPLQVKVLDFGVARIDDEHGADVDDDIGKQLRQAVGIVSDGGVSTSSDADVRARSSANGGGTRTVTLNCTAQDGNVGTLPYLAPELFDGEGATRASDLYAFGVVAYEALVGKRPFSVSSIATARELLRQEPSPAQESNGALGPEISRALAWGLSHRASGRPASAGALVGALRSAHHQSRCRAWVRVETPRRRRLSALLAVLLSAAVWAADSGGFASSLEQRVVDAEFQLAPKSAPDPRLMLVAVDDASLAQDPTVLGERADEFADRLERILAAGASGVAIDFLLPQRWSTSSRFSRLVLTRANQLALAAMSAPNGTVIGPECLTGLTAATLGPERTSALFGFTNLEPDSDGVVRHGRIVFRDTTGAPRDSFPARSIRAGFGEGPLARALGGPPREADSARFRIDASIDSSRIPVVSWNRVAETLEHEPVLFRDRLVLVGGDLLASGDVHWLSGADTPVAGIRLQAVITSTILGGLSVRDVGIGLLLPVIALCAWCAAERILQLPRLGVPVWTLTLAAGWILASALAFLSRQLVVPVLLPLAAIAGASGIAAGLRRVLPPYPEV
jgi:serine/threonine protein kinase